MVRCGLPPALVLGEGTVSRPRSQSTSDQVSENGSLGVRRPPNQARATRSRHQTFGQLSMTRSASSTGT
jgi:hypothetical protein